VSGWVRGSGFELEANDEDRGGDLRVHAGSIREEKQRA
jgi:hypothetical protein